MTQINEQPARILVEQFSAIADKLPDGPILDLACGNGRNGMYLVKQGKNVIFADSNKECLRYIDRCPTLQARAKGTSTTWHVDFELAQQSPLQGNKFAAVIVFNYLHRPLFDSIKDAVIPGGYVFYETFTRKQAEFGRPKSPDYLLKENELAGLFASWHIEHYRESIEQMPTKSVTSNPVSYKAIANIVARKPAQEHNL